MKLFENKLFKAQSSLEYALLIVVVVGVLITMQRFYSMSLQGGYKQTVDRLGSERISGQTYGPGKWYAAKGGSAFTERSNWGFDYEHGIITSFGISTGGVHTTSQSKISGVTAPNLYYPGGVKALLDGGEDKSFFQSATSSSIGPDMSVVDANVASNVKGWNYGHTEDNGKEMSEAVDQTFTDNVESISDKYVLKEGDPDTYSAEYGATYEATKLEAKNNQYAQNEGYALDTSAPKEGADLDKD